MRNSLSGFRAAWIHEAAFREEVLLGVPLIVVAVLAARSPLHAAALIGSILLVWLTELLNSAIEGLADVLCPDFDARIGLVKDLASAAVLTSLAIAIVTWCAVFIL